MDLYQPFAAIGPRREEGGAAWEREDRIQGLLVLPRSTPAHNLPSNFPSPQLASGHNLPLVASSSSTHNHRIGLALIHTPCLIHNCAEHQRRCLSLIYKCNYSFLALQNSFDPLCEIPCTAHKVSFVAAKEFHSLSHTPTPPITATEDTLNMVSDP